MRSLALLAAVTLSLTLTPDARAQQASAPTPDQRAAAALERKVTVNFDQTPLDEVAAFLSDILEANVVVAPGYEEVQVSMRLRDVTAKTALALAAAGGELEVSVGCGVIYVHPTGEGLGQVPALAPDLRARLLTVCFEETAVSEVVLFLQDITGANVATAAGASDAAVTLRVRDLPLDLALAVIARQAGLVCRVKQGVIVFERG
jgi:type II secretory pathway component GspD/PulD (secretin)